MRKPNSPAALAERIAALEERVTRLEKGEAPPGDGRASHAEARRAVKRCPGCGLPLRQRKGRCAACGRPVASL
ncbi:MAG TPA: hypothetical protein VF912_11375 [Anaeromyxobacter sp.]